MTIYFMAFRCGFLWQVWEFDPVYSRRIAFRLRLNWRSMEPKREWEVTMGDEGGLSYSEKSPMRNGAWCLRGPWVKVR